VTGFCSVDGKFKLSCYSTRNQYTDFTQALLPYLLTHSITVLCSGTPGVGKSTLCEQLAERAGLEWLEVGQIAKDCECFEDFDEVYQCPVLDEDKVHS
jgi:Ni2+-binding GTPase involved in maturation of urease and hydrogenase